MIRFIKALTVFIGTIVGVGIFTLPYVTSRAGFLPVLIYFAILYAVVIATHSLLGEVALKTETLHRFPGYVGEYLGLNWQRFSLLIFGCGITGTLLAYLIVGGEFLWRFLAPYFGGNVLSYTLLFFAAGSYLVFRGMKVISQIELILTPVFFTIIAAFFVRALPFIKMEHFQYFNPGFLALPYGTILFAMWGSAIVPEIKEMVGGEEKLLRRVLIAGTAITTLTYLLFIFIIFGASGSLTSEEALSGFAVVLGDNIVRLGFIFGFITCFDSFFILGLTFKKVLWYDFNLPPGLSWFIACFGPLVLFLAGLRRFIDIIGFTGAVTIGAEGIMMVFLYREFLKKKMLRAMNPLWYFLIFFFAAGIMIEAFYFITRL